jgi:hypothetical protein
MGPLKDYYCWEIMHCDKSKNCAVRKNPTKACWEVVKEKNADYRHLFNICQDCIVKVLKTNNAVLSPHEIKTIVASKINCCLLGKPTRKSLPAQNVMPLPPG